jgi:hypothetical protein
MKIKSITYKRIKNLGNYQSETLEMTAELEGWEGHKETAELLRAKVLSVLFPENSTDSDAPIIF